MGPCAASVGDAHGGTAGRVTDLSPPVIDQLVAVELLADPDAVAARLEQVRRRRDALEGALAEHCPGWEWRHPAGGLALWLRLHAPIATALASAALRVGVRLVPGGRFLADGSAERYLRLPFTLPPAHLAEAVRRLASVRDDLGEPPVPAVVA